MTTGGSGSDRNEMRVRDDSSINSGIKSIRSRQSQHDNHNNNHNIVPFQYYGGSGPKNNSLSRMNSAPHLVRNSHISGYGSGTGNANGTGNGSGGGSGSGGGTGGNFKAFSRHSDLPSSPSKDRKAAGNVILY